MYIMFNGGGSIPQKDKQGTEEYRISSNRRPGVYFLRDSADPAFKQGRRLLSARISCPRPPTLLAHAEVEITSVRATVRERQAQSIAFNLKDTSKHLFCAIGVAVGEVQLSPLSLPPGAQTTCHAPKLVPGRPRPGVYLLYCP